MVSDLGELFCLRPIGTGTKMWQHHSGRALRPLRTDNEFLLLFYDVKLLVLGFGYVFFQRRFPYITDNHNNARRTARI